MAELLPNHTHGDRERRRQMAKRIDIIRERKVYENKYGCLYDDNVEFTHNKSRGTYVRWVWKAPYSVAILPMLSLTEFAVVASFRHSARKPILEVPKGFGEAGKEPSLVARNELREELGLQCLELDYVGTAVTDAAFSFHPMYLFIAKNCSKCTAAHEPSEAIIGMHKMSILDFPTVLNQGILQDAITLLLISLARHNQEQVT